MPDDLSTLISNSLRTLLSETLFRAADDGAYVINRGELGFVDTLKSLSAEVASTPPRSGRKPIVSHANHVLFGLDLVDRAVNGDQHAFDNVNWDSAWKLERVNDAEWLTLLNKLETTAEHLVETTSKLRGWHQMMLTGCFATAAHTAYHLGAIRQILHDLKPGK